MIEFAADIIPDLTVKSAGSLNTCPGGSNRTALRAGPGDNVALGAYWIPSERFAFVKEVHLLLQKLGTIGSGKTLTVRLESDDGYGLPSGTILGTSDPIETDDISTDVAKWIVFTFLDHVQLVKDMRYHFVLTGDYDPSPANAIVWISSIVSALGNQEIQDASWAAVPTEDFNIIAILWDLVALGLAEPVLYDGQEYPAIFQAPGSVGVIGETYVQSALPSIEIRSSDIPNPILDTEVKVRSVSYYVHELVPDSGGTQKIMLSEDKIS